MNIRFLFSVCLFGVDFCGDVEVEAVVVERFMKDNVLFSKDVNRD